MTHLVQDLIDDLKRTVLSPPSKRALIEINAAAGIEIRFCRLEWCDRPFVPKKPDHFYCSERHSDEDWNKKRREG